MDAIFRLFFPDVHLEIGFLFLFRNGSGSVSLVLKTKLYGYTRRTEGAAGVFLRFSYRFSCFCFETVPGLSLSFLKPSYIAARCAVFLTCFCFERVPGPSLSFLKPSYMATRSAAGVFLFSCLELNKPKTGKFAIQSARVELLFFFHFLNSRSGKPNRTKTERFSAARVYLHQITEHRCSKTQESP